MGNLVGNRKGRSHWTGPVNTLVFGSFWSGKLFDAEAERPVSSWASISFHDTSCFWSPAMRPSTQLRSVRTLSAIWLCASRDDAVDLFRGRLRLQLHYSPKPAFPVVDSQPRADTAHTRGRTRLGNARKGILQLCTTSLKLRGPLRLDRSLRSGDGCQRLKLTWPLRVVCGPCPPAGMHPQFHAAHC